ncbi:IE-1 [Spodoptera littoralis nucleopolyhedrovirus]|uniref:IE-1 n=1 Tax=Spodoptera littoralis nuclear polyhedrosis virus TaxID=10456 RepID=M1J432_NPVSL|nr:IE-1 [Spodoptera littoralis nucleopolyhedrovirus]AGE89869.1 IE-1 [Spodoptera littoralis nucleopolyhedrovirus]AYU75207.1 IE-1 immediate early protein [Spodoptera littoralis nucleopolyhedrovirus]
MKMLHKQKLDRHQQQHQLVADDDYNTEHLVEDFADEFGSFDNDSEQQQQQDYNASHQTPKCEDVSEMIDKIKIFNDRINIEKELELDNLFFQQQQQQQIMPTPPPSVRDLPVLNETPSVTPSVRVNETPSVRESAPIIPIYGKGKMMKKSGKNMSKILKSNGGDNGDDSSSDDSGNETKSSSCGSKKQPRYKKKRAAIVAKPPTSKPIISSSDDSSSDSSTEDDAPRDQSNGRDRSRSNSPVNDPVVEEQQRRMSSNGQHSAAINMIINDDNADFGAETDQSRRFVDFYTSKLYHMFIISPKTGDVDGDPTAYELRYVNTVHSVLSEYRKYFSKLSNKVLVVTMARYRFMIVERVLHAMNINIPLLERIEEPKDNEISFNEVKDSNFFNLLVHTFNLNTTIVQTDIAFMYSALSQSKAMYVHNKMNKLVTDKTLFTLPINVSRRDIVFEASEIAANVTVPTSRATAIATKESATNVSTTMPISASDEQPLYITDIVKACRFSTFAVNDHGAKSSPNKLESYIKNLTEELKFWLPNASGEDVKKIRSSFTYKYSSVARLFYKDRDLYLFKKVRKTKGNKSLVEAYLNAMNDHSIHSFILVDTKNEERLAIIKKGKVYVWINCIISSDIVPEDIIHKHKDGTHYVFAMKRTNRKEVHARLNGMLKLVSTYVDESLKMKYVIKIAQDIFGANCEIIKYDDGRPMDHRDSSPPPSTSAEEVRPIKRSIDDSVRPIKRSIDDSSSIKKSKKIKL